MTAYPMVKFDVHDRLISLCSVLSGELKSRLVDDNRKI